MLEMFESKIVKIVKKLPRSHLILLEQVHHHFKNQQDEEALREVHLTETELLDMYNRKARQLCIDRSTPGDISDIVQTLTNSDILMTVIGKNQKVITPQQMALKLI